MTLCLRLIHNFVTLKYKENYCSTPRNDRYYIHTCNTKHPYLVPANSDFHIQQQNPLWFSRSAFRYPAVPWIAYLKSLLAKNPQVRLSDSGNNFTPSLLLCKLNTLSYSTPFLFWEVVESNTDKNTEQMVYKWIFFFLPICF